MSMQIMSSGGTFSFRELLLPSDDISDWPAKLFFLELSLKKNQKNRINDWHLVYSSAHLFPWQIFFKKSVVTLFDMSNNDLSFDKKKIHAFFNFWRAQFAY